MGHCCSYPNMATRPLHGSHHRGQVIPSALVGRRFSRPLFLRPIEIKLAVQKTSVVSEGSKRPFATAEKSSLVNSGEAKFGFAICTRCGYTDGGKE